MEKRVPYGEVDLKKIREEGYIYRDKINRRLHKQFDVWGTVGFSFSVYAQ